MRKTLALLPALAAASAFSGGCGSSPASPTKKADGGMADAAALPAALKVPGEYVILDETSKYILIQDRTTNAWSLVPVPATGTDLGAKIAVPNGSQQTDTTQWVRTINQAFYIDGAGMTGVKLYQWDPGTGAAKVIASDLADTLVQTSTGGTAGSVGQSFAISPDGNYVAYLTMTGGTGAHDAGTPADMGVRDGGAKADAGPPDAAPPPPTGWNLALVPITGGSATIVAHDLDPTNTQYYFTTDSKYLIVTDLLTFDSSSGAPTSASYAVTPVAGAATDSVRALVAHGGVSAVFTPTDDLAVLDNFSGTGTGDLHLFTGLDPTKNTLVASNVLPALAGAAGTIYYIEGASSGASTGTLKALVAGSAPATVAPTAAGFFAISPDGKWAAYSSVPASSSSFGDLWMATAGGTPTMLAAAPGGVDIFAPDSTSFTFETNIDMYGVGPLETVTLSGTKATPGSPFAQKNYFAWYRDGKTVVYDDNANGLGNYSDWYQIPAAGGTPTLIYKRVSFDKATTLPYLVLIPDDNSRAAFIITNQDKKDGLYAVTLPSE